MFPTKRAFEAIHRYLDGDENAFSTFSIKDFNREFYELPISYIDEEFTLKEDIQALLNKLNVPTDAQVKYLRSTATIQGFLKLLSDRAKRIDTQGNPTLDALIKKIDNFQLIKTLQFFDQHLQDKKGEKDLLNYMTSYDKKMAKVNKDFYTTTVNSDPEVLQAVENVLERLGLPQQQWGRYTGSSLTVHQMLKEVAEHTNKSPENKEKLAQVTSLAKMIKAKSRLSWQKAFLYSLVAVFPVVASIPFGGGGFIAQIVTAALFPPTLGLTGTFGGALYSLYKTTYDKNIPVLDKILDNFLVLTGTILKAAAYGLVIATAVTGLPVVGILTVAAAGVGILREGFKLMQMNLKGKAEQVKTGPENLMSKQQDARFNSDYEKKKKSLWIELSAAVVLTGIAAVSCFGPGGSIIVASAAIATVVTYISQWAINKYIEKSAKKELHGNFGRLETEDEAEKNALQAQSELSKKGSLVAKLSENPEVARTHRAAFQEVATQTDENDNISDVSSSDSSGYNSEQGNTPLEKEVVDDAELDEGTPTPGRFSKGV